MRDGRAAPAVADVTGPTRAGRAPREHAASAPSILFVATDIGVRAALGIPLGRFFRVVNAASVRDAFLPRREGRGWK